MSLANIFFLFLLGVCVVLSVYLWKKARRGAGIFTVGSSLLLAITGIGASYYNDLTDVMFNIISLLWVSSLIGTMYLALKRTKVFVLLAIPAALSTRIFVTIDTNLFTAGLTLFLGVWNSYDYSDVNIAKLRSKPKERFFLAPFSWTDRLLRPRVQQRRLRLSLFLSYTTISTIFVLAPLLVYVVLGFRLVTDILLVTSVAFLGLGRVVYLRWFSNR